jgi:signal peptidase I
MKILDRAQSRIPQPWRTIVDWFVTIAAAVVLVLAFQAQVAKPYRIPTPSMEPTLQAPLRETNSFLPRAIQRPGDRQPACVQVR